MESYTSILQLLSVILCVAGGLLLWQAAWSTKRLPPGPRGLPIIGHLHLLGKSPHKSLFRLSKIHGPLMWLRFGSVPVIVASTPQAARLILQENDQVFAGRPPLVSAACLTYGYKDIAFCPPNSYWKLMRQICVTDLASSKRVASFQPVRESEAYCLLGSIMEEILRVIPASEACAFKSAHSVTNADPQMLTGRTVSRAPTLVSVRPKLLQASNNTISRMVFGKKLSDVISSRLHDDPSLNLLKLLDELLHCLGVFNLGDLIPSIAWMDLQGVRRRSCVAAHKLDIVLQEILETRRYHVRDTNTSSFNHQEDLLDVLLSFSEKNTQIADDNIKAFIQDMFIGGTDTSAYTIEWALTELLGNPSKMKVVQEEIEMTVGKERLVKESDLAQLPYLRAVVSETMRLHPIIPFLLPHLATQPCKLLDFNVPASAHAYVNVWAIGRDASTWEEPLVFKPERFLNSRVSLGVQNFELLPFGAGRRGCPGWLLGLLSVQLQLASLLQGFDWFAPPHFDMQDKFGIMTTKEKPLMALAAPKLPPYLYSDAAA